MPTIHRVAFTLCLTLPLLGAITGCSSSFTSPAPQTAETFAPGHLVVVYRDHTIPQASAAIAAQVGGHITNDLPLFGLSSLQVSGDESAAIAALLTDPRVAAVLRDRIVTAHLIVIPPSDPGLGKIRARIPLGPPDTGMPASDPFYNSPQGWAVLASGGFGDNIPGGPALGPWNTSRGAGTRIAVLDSGVDAKHPDIAPNLALNLSEIDTVALPSPCDDGSSADQQGHGTFTASLAAAAIGGGDLIGVAPQASVLNIKVLQRMPATAGSTPTAQCEAGQASGLLSWVLLGLQDAIAQHANVVSLSLGTLVDTSTGDGDGWKAQFDAATYAAQQAGIVVVGALGNDALDLSTSHLIELPAQARGVLPVVASTNPACAEDLAENAICAPGPVTRASYSNHGVAGAIAAPGGSYPQGSTTNGITGFVRGACSSGLDNTTDGLPTNGQSFGCFGLGHTQYVQAIGTSASAPLVAGAAALLIAAHRNWSAAQVIQSLRSTASALPSLPEPTLNLPTALVRP